MLLNGFGVKIFKSQHAYLVCDCLLLLLLLFLLLLMKASTSRRIGGVGMSNTELHVYFVETDMSKLVERVLSV